MGDHRFLASSLFGVLLASSLAHAAVSNPSFITIDHVTYTGAGCPAGSLAYSLSTDQEAITLLFSNFDVATDAVSTRGCAIVLGLSVPPGWQYALFSVDTRGYAQMTPQAAGYHATSYQFAGGPVNALGVSRYSGPFANDYFDHEEINVSANNWSPCNSAGQNLALYLQMSVSGAEGLMTIDSADGQLSHELGVRWRHCPSVDTNRRFIEQLYADVLGRWAADTEINSWVARVSPNNREALALNFLESPEHRVHEAKADYITYLGRPATSTEIQFQMEQFRRGITTDQMITAFTSSPEFYARSGGSPEGFIAAVYRVLLGRAASPGEINFWLHQAVIDRAVVAQKVLFSEESRMHQVAQWYLRYLGRKGTPSEWQVWTNVAGRPDASEYIQAGLIGSPEYFKMRR